MNQKRERKINLKALALVLAVMLGFAAFLGAADAKNLKEELVIAMRSDPKTIDPQRTIDVVSNKSIQLMYESLLELDADLKLKPSLAEKWERIDALSAVFYLKKGVKFHNGDEMTSEDVVFSLERGKVSPQCKFEFDSFDKIEAIDKYTVKVTTKEPFGVLFDNVASTHGGIINKRAYLENGEDTITKAVGTGPYKLKDWFAGDRITFEAFDGYWGDPVKIKKITIRTIPEQANRTIALETGEADMSFDISLQDKDAILANKKLVLMEVESPSEWYLGFDQTNPRYQNKKLRQAIACAVDNKVFVDTVFRGSAVAATSPLPKACPDHIDVDTWEYNPERAKELLKEAGYPNGLDIELWVNDDQTRIDICVIMQDALKAIGINAEIKVFEWGAYISRTAQPNKELYFLSWNTTGDGDAHMYPLFHSSQHGSSGNRSYFTNAEIDALIEKGRHSVNPEERTGIYHTLQKMLNEELPHYTVVYPMLSLAMTNKVKGLIFKKNGYVDLRHTYIEK
ncbi:MAG: ABC transporter substrate-binding protein [Fusobacteriaceae bacterium]|nr:ABC transporter substrate-binding protein [Fusobacteriaceae bacterium]